MGTLHIMIVPFRIAYMHNLKTQFWWKIVPHLEINLSTWIVVNFRPKNIKSGTMDLTGFNFCLYVDIFHAQKTE